MKIYHHLMSIVVFLFILFFPQTSYAYSLEELAELLCDNYDGVSCDFGSHEGIYKFGSHHLVHKGNGKIRSEAAYCLIRDGDGATADATVGDEGEWNHFGTQSRLHVTYAGVNEDGEYRAEGQRLLDLVLLGHTLYGAEVQDLLANFPIETEKVKNKTCKKWLQVGGKKMCGQWSPTLKSRKGYYLELDTNFYAWDIDIDEVAGDLSALFGGPPMPEGLEIALGQDVSFEYYGTTELSGNDLILDDGIIPSIAYSGNIWEWGHDPDDDEVTSYLDIEVPVLDVEFASLTLFFDVHGNGYYALEEGPWVSDPDSGQLDTPLDYNEMTTSTYLAAETDVGFTIEACLDFIFDTWCGDFEVPILDESEQRDPLNRITYTSWGVPKNSLWASGDASDDNRAVTDEINTCLYAETVVQDPEEPAGPSDWVEFVEAVAQTAADHYSPCYVIEPQNTVVAQAPSFKLCDDGGHVFEATTFFSR